MSPSLEDRPARVRWIGGETLQRDVMQHLDVDVDVIASDTDAGDTLDDIDCLVCKHEPPDTDGIELLRTVRKRNTNIPCILVGDGHAATVREALNEGADAFVDKRDGPRDVRLARHIERGIERYRRYRSEASERARLRTLVETTQDVLWMFPPDWEEVLYVTDSYEEVWGQPIETLQTDPTAFLDAVHPDDRERVQESMAALSAGESMELEYRVNPTEEFGRWVWVQGEPIYEDGTLAYIVGFARDVTERKHRERELERQTHQFEAVFDDPQLLVALLELDGTVRRVNDTAMSSLEVTRESILGTPFWETPWWNHDPDLQDRVRGWIERAASGEYVEFEATHVTGTGNELFVSGTIRPVTDETGAVDALVVSARDITERTAHKRKLEQSNERLEQFAYIASHDLQEPIRTVSNYTELIAEEYGDELDEEADRLIDVVVTASERMQSMINGLLDYSRVTTRGEAFEPVDANDVVADVVDDLGLVLDTHNGTVEWDDLPTVEADPSQFRRVFQNLITNALEHAEDESVAVQIRASELQDVYRFEVEDDGPGIAENRQEKIFRIFKSGTQYQTSSQAKGIGLAVCDNIVQRHGGEIWVDSEPEKGSTFAFTIAKRNTD